MEISKTVCNENPPFNVGSNYSISFNLNSALMDLTASYVNVPIKAEEKYSSNFSVSDVPIGNVNIGNDLFVDSASKVSAYLIRNVNLEADGMPVCYTQFINTLATNLAVYMYNNGEARFIEYMATEEPTVDENLILANSKNHLYSSLYRELFNNGNTQSLKNEAFVRIPLKQILGQYATQIRDLTKYQKVVLTLQLDNLDLATHANSDSYFPDNATVGAPNERTVCIQNAHPLSDFGYNAPIAGTVTGGNLFTLTTIDILAYQFPLRIGDSITFTSQAGAKVITALNLSVDNYLVSLSFGAGGLTNQADSIPINTVGTRGCFSIPDLTVAEVTEKWLNKSISYIKATGGQLVNFNNDSASIVYVQQQGGATGDAVCVIGVGSYASATIPGGYLALNGLTLNYTGSASLPAGSALDTVANFTQKTFSFWTGQAVYISGSANVTPMYAKITGISYSGGKAQVKLNKALTVSGGNVAQLNLFSIHPDEINLVLDKKWELVQLKLNSMFAKQLQLSDKYEKWVYDGDVVLPMAPQGSYEKTFLLDPLTKLCVLCITKDNLLNSTKDTLSKYRILLDGKDVTNRDIDLNDESMKNERLISGFNSFYEDLHCTQTKTTNNPFSVDNNSYTIFQEVPLDGKEHKLTILLRNGSALSTLSNLRLYKLVVSQIK